MNPHLFDEAVGELPPSTVDVAGIVRREKSRGAALRLSSVATGVVALAISVAVVLTMGGGTGASSPPVGSSGSSVSPTPSDTRFALIADSEESAAATAERLTKALDAAYRKEAPGATWIFEPHNPDRTGPDDRPPTLRYGRTDRASEAKVGGGGGILVNGRKGALNLSIGKNDPKYHLVDCSMWRGDCEERTSPDGVKGVFIVVTYEASSPVRSYLARVLLADGRVLHLDTTNDFGPDHAGAAQPEMPLTKEQTWAIALAVAGQIKA